MSSVLLRYPGEVDARIDALIEKMRDDSDLRAVRLSRSALLRMFVFEGLETYERRYNGAKE